MRVMGMRSDMVRSLCRNLPKRKKMRPPPGETDGIIVPCGWRSVKPKELCCSMPSVRAERNHIYYIYYVFLPGRVSSSKYSTRPHDLHSTTRPMLISFTMLEVSC